MEAEQLYDLGSGKVVAGRFRVIGAHRHGELATAFDVTDLEADDPAQDRCGMHVFPIGIFENEQQALAFSSSWKAWMRVESSAVLRVREVVNVGSGFLLISDSPDGDPLRDVLKNEGPLSAADVLHIGCQLLEGLVELHTHGLVHGDVKPSTIYVAGTAPQRRAILVDGGITHSLWSAKNLGDKTALIGTPHYAPVEQFGGDPPDIQSDVYNTATVLFELLTGVLPWSGRSFLEVFQAKLDKAAPSMRARCPEVEVDPAIERAVVTGLLADKSARYASAKDFLEALRSFE